MHPTDLFGAVGGGGDFGNRQRGGVRREDGVLGCVLVELPEDVLLDFHLLGGSLDDEVGVLGGGFEVDCGVDSLHHVGGRLVDEAFFGEFLQGPLDVLVALVDQLLFDVAHRHLIPRQGNDLSDTVSHASRAENRHSVDGVDSHTADSAVGRDLRIPHAVTVVRNSS